MRDHDDEGTIRAALQGVGLVQHLAPAVRPWLADSRLVRVLQPWCKPFPGLYLYAPTRKQMPARARALIDFLVEKREVTKGKTMHLIADNYAINKHPAVQEWLAKHPRFNMHLTPTSASWLNMVERCFRDIMTERLRRGVFTSVPELEAAINDCIAHHNIDPTAFIWTKSARDILQKVIRADARLSSKQTETLH